MTAQGHTLAISQIQRKLKIVCTTVSEVQSVTVDGKVIFDADSDGHAEVSVSNGTATVVLTFPVASYIVNTEVRED